MPTIFFARGFRFFFYSLEHEPIHIHLTGKGGSAKIEVVSMQVIENKNMKPADLKAALEEITERRDLIIAEWNKRFNS